MKLKTDFHIHTADDPIDCISHSATKLISTAGQRGFKAISITNHDKLTYNRELYSYARDQGVLLIPGIEKNVEGKHILILNATHSAEKINTFRDLRIAKREDDIFTIAPHPFFKTAFCLEEKLLEHIELFDAIEFTFFYSRFINLNKKAVRAARHVDMPVIGNSDLHMLKNLGACYSLIQSNEITIEGVFEGIRNHRVEVISKPLSLVGMFVSYLDLQYTLYKNNSKLKKIPIKPKAILGYLRSIST